MSEFPTVLPELAGLRSVLADPRLAGTAAGGRLADLRLRADRLLLRLSAPLKVAILGAPGSGKSAIANLLIGRAIIPAGAAVPVIVRHGEAAHTVAGWWSGIEAPGATVDFAAAFAARPDFVELCLTEDILRNVSFLDLPSLTAVKARREQFTWAAARADMLLWCLRADTGAVDLERAFWPLIPPRLQGRGYLLATHMDAPALGPDRGRIAETLRAGAVPPFRDVIALASPIALEAAPAGMVMDSAAWESSGGRALLDGLIGLAVAIRQRDIEAARQVVAALDALAREMPQPSEMPEVPNLTAPDPGVPAAVAGFAPDAEAPSDIAPAPALSDPADPFFGATAPVGLAPPVAAGPLVLAHLRDGIAALTALIEARDHLRPGPFLGHAAELIEALTALVAAPAALRPEGQWMRDEIEAAHAAMASIRSGMDARSCYDAATLVLQLTRDLGWAAMPAEDGAAADV